MLFTRNVQTGCGTTGDKVMALGVVLGIVHYIPMPNREMIVLSKQQAQQYTSTTPWSAISVSTEIEGFPQLSTANRISMLRLCFWDICKPVRNNDARTKSRMFRKEQAEEVLRFVHNHW